MKKLSVFAVVLFATALLTVSGCTQNSGKKQVDEVSASEATEEPTVKTPEPKTDSPPYPGPNVTFKDGNGKVVSVKDLYGKVVFINFWATWCPPCIREMPSIHQLKKSFEGNEDIVFLMVDVDGKHAQAQAFMDTNKYDFPVLIPHGDIPTEFLGGSIPTTVVIAKDGNMVARVEGSRDYAAPEVIKSLTELIER